MTMKEHLDLSGLPLIIAMILGFKTIAVLRADGIVFNIILISSAFKMKTCVATGILYNV